VIREGQQRCRVERAGRRNTLEYEHTRGGAPRAYHQLPGRERQGARLARKSLQEDGSGRPAHRRQKCQNEAERDLACQDKRPPEGNQARHPKPEPEEPSCVEVLAKNQAGEDRPAW
jgi:hypothetical protein